MARMSPADHLSGVKAPVLILHESGDPYIASWESEWLAREMPPSSKVDVTLTSVLEHVELRTPPPTPTNIWRFYLPEGWKLFSFIYKTFAEARV